QTETVPRLPELRIQYKDYSAWQLAQLSQAPFEAHRKYWLDKLSGELPQLDLPGIKQRPVIKTYRGKGFSTYLDRGLTLKLNQFAKEQGGSIFMSLMATWNVLMYRYTSQTDIIIGTPVAGREHPELEEQIGFYVNTLALRNEVKPDQSFKQLYKEFTGNSLEAFSHQMYPFDRLVEELDLEQDTSRSAVFDMMLTLQNNGENDSSFELSDAEINEIRTSEIFTSKFDIDIVFKEEGDYLLFQLVYNPDIYHGKDMEALMRNYKQLLSALLLSPEVSVGKVDYLSPEQKYELVELFNDTSVNYPTGKSIVDFFTDQVKKSGDRQAVVFGQEVLSYQRLDEVSSQLAHYLISQNTIKPYDLIAIKLERSEWVIVSILAVLKSGAAYVPVDPEYPQERISYIEKDSNCKLTIDAELIDNFRKSEKQFSSDEVKVYPSAEDLAYVLYTSGSTGQPKGVMIQHSSVLNTILAYSDMVRLDDTHRGLQFSSFAFDASVLEIFTILLSGGCLVIASLEERTDSELLSELISKQQVDVAILPPSYLNELAPESLKGLKKLTTGGEAPKHERVVRHLEYGAYYNAYGPTEASICATMYKMKSAGGLTSKVIPMGSPIPNAKIYVLDAQHQLLPKGVTGEIFIGGLGLAAGYLNREELTKEKFIDNPFVYGERLYKTGDMGRWLSDGNLEFVGRKDDQVKVRGFRIELGEIENTLLQHDDVGQVVVIAKQIRSDENELVAYFTAEQQLDTGELHNYLKAALPAFMIPSYMIQLDALPLTVNGKIDKKSLPDPEQTVNKTGSDYVAPESELETSMVSLWESVLGKGQIGMNDNFFDLGGNSLKAMKLLSSLRFSQEKTIQLTDIYRYPSPNGLVSYLNDTEVKSIENQIVMLNGYSSSRINLLLLPTIIGQSSIFAGLTRAMDRHFNVFSVDYQSFVTDHVATIEQLASAIFNSFETITKGEKAIVGGYSVGSRIAIEVSRKMQMKDNLLGLLMIEGLTQNIVDEKLDVEVELAYFKKYLFDTTGGNSSLISELSDYEAIFRKLIEIDGKYRFGDKLNTNVLSVYGNSGELINVSDSKITTGDHTRITVEGDHNTVLHSNEALINKEVIELIGKSAETQPENSEIS
ncbi:MAG: amino acid adenylation domain-containing protein, partial [Cyclobacteriaceae bacterium]